MGIISTISSIVIAIVGVMFIFNLKLLIKTIDIFTKETIEEMREMKRDIMEKNEETKSELVRIFVKETKEEKEKNTKRSESAKRMWAERKKKAAEQDIQQPQKITSDQH